MLVAVLTSGHHCDPIVSRAYSLVLLARRSAECFADDLAKAFHSQARFMNLLNAAFHRVGLVIDVHGKISEP